MQGATRVNVPTLAADQMEAEGGRVVQDHGLVTHLGFNFGGKVFEKSISNCDEQRS
jgi:hypothetical protein